MTITYPTEPRATKETFGVGARVDVDAKRVHEVWMGEGVVSMSLGKCEGGWGRGVNLIRVEGLKMKTAMHKSISCD